MTTMMILGKKSKSKRSRAFPLTGERTNNNLEGCLENKELINVLGKVTLFENYLTNLEVFPDFDCVSGFNISHIHTYSSCV